MNGLGIEGKEPRNLVSLNPNIFRQAIRGPSRWGAVNEAYIEGTGGYQVYMLRGALGTKSVPHLGV